MTQLLNYLLLPRISVHGICVICTFLSSYILLDPAQNKSCAAVPARTRIFSPSVSIGYTVVERNLKEDMAQNL